MNYKYNQITSHFVDAIHSGALSIGARLPSLRAVCSQWGCSLSVAQQAYAQLEQQALVRTVEKSGVFVAAPLHTKLPNPARKSSGLIPQKPRTGDLVRRVLALVENPRIVPLHCAIPHASLLPLRALQRHVKAVLEEDSGVLSAYSPAAGSVALRKEIVKLMIAKGVLVRPEEVVITNGCMEALNVAIEACSEKGQTVAIETPAFFGMISLLEQMGRNVIAIPTHAQTGLDLACLQRVLETESVALVMVTPNYQNPLGSLMPDANKQELCALAKKHSFYVVEDDIYGECSHEKHALKAVKSFDTYGRVLYCASFSKVLSPGMRLGWILPGPLQERIENIKQRSTLGGPILIQEAMARFLATGGLHRHLQMFRGLIAGQVRQMRALILQCFPEGTRVSMPVGGYFLWVEMPAGYDTLVLFEKALDAGIGITPGPAFSVRGSLYKNAMRISCANPVDARIQHAIEKLGTMLKKI